MTQLQILLPEHAQRFIEEQVASGRYQSPSDYVANLIEQARLKMGQEKLTQLIREGMESGEGEEITDEYWERFDERLAAELKRRRSA